MANPDPTLMLYSMLEKAEANARSDDPDGVVPFALRDMCEEEGDESDKPDLISR